MRAYLVKPRGHSVDPMSSRLKIMNNYLTSFPSLDNKSCTEHHYFFLGKENGNGRLEPKKKVYEDLIEHLEKLDASLLEDPQRRGKGKLSILKSIKFQGRKKEQ